MPARLKKSSASGDAFSDDAGAQDGAHIVRVTPGNVREIMMWAEFDRFSPLGDERADFRAAQIVSAVYGAQGVKVSLNDALLQWEKEQTEGASDPFAGLENALLIVSQ